MIKNCTPHDVTVFGRSIPASGVVPRLATHRVPVGTVDGLPVDRVTFGQVIDLPSQVDGVVLVVSALVAETRPDRDDLASPGDLIRDADGRVVGAASLCAGPGLARRLAVPCASCGRAGGEPDLFGCTLPGCTY